MCNSVASLYAERSAVNFVCRLWNLGTLILGAITLQNQITKFPGEKHKQNTTNPQAALCFSLKVIKMINDNKHNNKSYNKK